MKCMDKHGFEQQNVFGTGAANTAYARFFIGQSFLNPLTDPKTGLFLANVTFEPAAATTGISTRGQGRRPAAGLHRRRRLVPGRGKTAVSLTPGTVITIPANVKHWHGAKADSWFSHIAVEVPGKDCSNEWCEPVTDEEYAKLNG